MKIFFIVPLLFLSLGLNSFNNLPTKVKSGIYSLNENIEYIQLNDDFTFTYVNKNTEVQEIKGTYSLKSGNLILETIEKLPINTIWKIDANEQCLKTRQRFAFLRICNC